MRRLSAEHLHVIAEIVLNDGARSRTFYTGAPGVGVAAGSLEQRARDQAEAAWRDLFARAIRTPLASKPE